MKHSTLIIFLLVLHITTNAQERTFIDYPVIGKPCPPFTLRDIDHHPQKEASLQDFKGQWIVLDFWTKTCVVCVKNFPKVNKLQEEFKDNIQFILIGKNDKKYNSEIRSLFEQFRRHYNLNLVAAYDSLLFDRFGVPSTPHIIIVDPRGIVQAITDTRSLTKENLYALINGETPVLKRKFGRFESNTSQDKKSIWSSLLTSTDSAFFLHKSLLAKWSDGDPIRIALEIKRENIKSASFNATCISLERLYNIAFFGKTDWRFTDSLYTIYWRYPVLNLTDSSLFQHNLDLEKGLYNYSLVIPKAKSSRQYLQWAMKCDLKKYFGYEIIIEKRVMPYWKLTASDKAKHDLKTKNGPKKFKKDHTGLILLNGSTNELLESIWSYHQKQIPFIDETGIIENIDIRIDAVLTDLDNIRQALMIHGLNLIKAKREFKVLVIRDSKETDNDLQFAP